MRAFALGDVADEGGQRALLAGADRIDHHLHGEFFAARPAGHRFQPPIEQLAVDRFLQRRENVSGKGIADHVAGSDVERGFCLRVPLEDDAVAIDCDHRVERRGDELVHARF